MKKRLWLQSGRENKGLTRSQLANELGVSIQIVAMWESGQKSPSRDATFRLADLLGPQVLEMFAAEARDRAPQQKSA